MFLFFYIYIFSANHDFNWFALSRRSRFFLKIIIYGITNFLRANRFEHPMLLRRNKISYTNHLFVLRFIKIVIVYFMSNTYLCITLHFIDKIRYFCVHTNIFKKN
jgi:hypothetical protein